MNMNINMNGKNMMGIMNDESEYDQKYESNELDNEIK